MNVSGTCARLLSPASLALDGFATESVSLMRIPACAANAPGSSLGFWRRNGDSIGIIKHVLPDGRLQSADHSMAGRRQG